ncbi:MAG: hypothetical protein GF335_01085 [Candidatus Moranbacteria bacterium]|nr:hypothetical protein [Candidatus Moranbacteria bacterium]
MTKTTNRGRNFQRRSANNDKKQKAINYFKRKPNRKNSFFKTSSSLGGKNQNLTIYLYWVLFGLTAIAIIYFLGSFLKTKGVSAKLIYNEGQVFIKRGEDKEWEPVETNEKIKKFNEIKTDENSRAVISFDDGNLIRMDEYSRVIFSTKDSNTLITQTDGNIYHRVAKTGKKKYIVELTGYEGVEKVSIEALGTAFWTQKIGMKTSAAVLESSILFSKGNEEGIRVEEGQKITLENDNKTKKDIEASDLQNNFLLWNIEQDEKKGMALSSYIKLKIAEVQTQEFDPDESALDNDPSSSNQQEQSEENNGKVILQGSATDEGIELEWELNDIKAPNGFKIVKDSEPDPVYPGSFYRSIRSSDTRSYIWNITDGKKHNFRICVADSSTGCKAYSNNIEIEAEEIDKDKKEEECEDSGGDWDKDEEKCDCPAGKELQNNQCAEPEEEENEEEEEEEEEKDDDDDDEEEEEEKDEEEEENYADSISLSGSSKDEGEATLTWDISDGEAPYGYKIVISKDKNPTYPQDDPVSITDPNDTKETLDLGEEAEGENYNFRVCIWNNVDKECVVYSNNVEIEIDD